MHAIGRITVVLITGLAMMDDLYRGKISNGFIVSGLILGILYQIFANGILGGVIWLGGTLFPIVILSGLYFFRMIGAGDIKLLAVAGSFVGPVRVWYCLVWSLIFGAVIVLGILYKKQNFLERIKFFGAYMNSCMKKKQWVPYLPQVNEDGKFCFSIPIFLAVVLQEISL